jgi:hypothetical protein
MAQAPQQPAQPGGAQLPQQGLTPEQTRQMQIMSKQAMRLLSEEATSDQIVQRAQQGDAKRVVAEVVSSVLRGLYAAASEAGQNIEMVTVLVTGIQIIGDLAEMLVAAGVVPAEQETQFVADTSKIAVELHNAALQQQGGAA